MLLRESELPPRGGIWCGMPGAAATLSRGEPRAGDTFYRLHLLFHLTSSHAFCCKPFAVAAGLNWSGARIERHRDERLFRRQGQRRQRCWWHLVRWKLFLGNDNLKNGHSEKGKKAKLSHVVKYGEIFTLLPLDCRPWFPLLGGARW